MGFCWFAFVRGGDVEVNMTPGGLPSPPTKRVVKCNKFDKILPEGEWEMILNGIVWSEGPAWWKDKFVFRQRSKN